MNKILLLLVFITYTGQLFADSHQRDVLKVCADPYMLPFSNKDKQGYENKIAELFAKKLGVKLEYTFFPQRIGFIRNTLRSENDNGLGYKCDLVITVPSHFELAATTKPYYTSTYMLVYAKDRHSMGEMKTAQDISDLVNQKNKDIKIGLSDKGPAQMWVFRNDLLANMTPYQGQVGDPKLNIAQKLIDEIVAGKIDATILWGPAAGYFVKQYKDKINLGMLPLKDNPDDPNMRFSFSMAMAVRYGEREWEKQVDQFIKDNKQDIEAILNGYDIPMVK